MPELLDYDEDPADTAAVRWLKTPVGMRTVELAMSSPETMLRRAFRTGFIRGEKVEIKNSKN